MKRLSHAYPRIHSPQSPLPSRLPHSFEQFHVRHSRSLLVIRFKYNSVYLSTTKSVSLFLFYKFIPQLTFQDAAQASFLWTPLSLFLPPLLPASTWRITDLCSGQWSLHRRPPLLLVCSPESVDFVVFTFSLPGSHMMTTAFSMLYILQGKAFVRNKAAPCVMQQNHTQIWASRYSVISKKKQDIAQYA